MLCLIFSWYLIFQLVFLCVGYDENTVCVGLSCVGCNDQNIVCTTLKKMKDTDIGPPLHSLVIPGKLHFLEIEMLKLFAENTEIFDKLVAMQNGST